MTILPGVLRLNLPLLAVGHADDVAFEIFPWNVSFETGIDLIDTQHQQLVVILNRLAKHFVSGTTSADGIETIIQELADYADYHFRCEEEVWHRHFNGHPMLSAHEQAHHDFFIKIASIRVNQGKLEDFADDLFGYLTRWLAFHILDNDKRMALATLRMDAGEPIEQALLSADEEMTGALAVLIRTVLDMYGELSAATIELMRQKLARQRAEDSLRDTSQQLADQELSLSEERYAVLFDAIPDAVVVVDIPSGRIVDVNGVAETLSGRSTAQLQQMAVFDLHPASERDFHIANLAGLTSAAHTDVAEARFETLVLHADGHLVDVEVSVRGPFRRGETLCLVGVMRDIRERKQHRQALEFVAYNDELTGLLNRNGIKRHIDALLKDRQSSGLVIHADLDNFSRINERYGAEFGDQVLKAFASQLQRDLPADSHMARLGGDEFLLVLQSAPSPDALHAYIVNLMSLLQRPVSIDHAAIQLTVSAGIKYFEKLQQTSAEVLLRQSSHALYLAKIQGASHFHVLDQFQENAERRRHALLMRIEHGLHNREFELFYQPQVDMLQGRVIGAEALLRWHHPQEGLLTPGSFIPATENHRVSAVIDAWVLQQTLQQLALWQTRWPHLKLSCNISAMSIQDVAFSNRLAAMLGDYSQVPPGNLEIELLESSAMADMTIAIATLEHLRTLGVGVAIDDFGTGYSSLSYLKRLPVEWLKLDQGFVADMGNNPDDAAIIQGIIAIGKAFDLSMIAEGVETLEQGALLISMGCQHGQGYAIAKPMPVLQFETWLSQWEPPAVWMNSASRAPL